MKIPIDLVQSSNYARTFRSIKLQESIVGDTKCIQRIGGWFVTDDSFAKHSFGPFSLTPTHGRVAVFPDSDGWVLIKGCGWTFGGPSHLVSPKDPALYFGLCDEVAASREYEVSLWLQNKGVHITPVLGYAKINDPEIKDSLFKNNSRVEPVLLYTRVIAPYRVADLAFIGETRRTAIIKSVCVVMGWDAENYLKEFIYSLTKNVSLMHQLNCCNDSLDISNTTLAAEITDFEWVSVPNIPLPFGDSTKDIVPRRCKELIYIYEIGIYLAAFLNISNPSKTIMKEMLSAYVVDNAEQILFLQRFTKNLV